MLCTVAPRSRTVPPDASIAIALIEFIAEIEETEPVELPPLYDTIDPEALEALFDQRPREALLRHDVTFHYHDYLISISCDGELVIEVKPSDLDGDERTLAQWNSH